MDLHRLPAWLGFSGAAPSASHPTPRRLRSAMRCTALLLLAAAATLAATAAALPQAPGQTSRRSLQDGDMGRAGLKEVVAAKMKEEGEMEIKDENGTVAVFGKQSHLVLILLAHSSPNPHPIVSQSRSRRRSRR